MDRLRLPIIFFGLMLFARETAAQPFGIETRAPNTSLLIDEVPPNSGAMRLAPAFGELYFDELLGLEEIPDG